MSGDVLAEVCDANNHTIDALRYALQPLIRAPKTGFLTFMAQEVDRMHARKAADSVEAKQQTAPIGSATQFGPTDPVRVAPIYDREGRLAKEHQ